MLFQHLALAAVNMAPALPFSVVGSEQCPAASPFLLLAEPAHIMRMFAYYS